jgi:uncharacterized membrane protein YhaH (DUF805 family)
LETIDLPASAPFILPKAICAQLVRKGAPMLGFLFGFNARLGRMHYFLGTIALAIVMTAICFAIATYLIQSSPRGLLSPASLMMWPTISAIVFFAWMTFALQSMRIRDIGWDPVCVIPAWIAILIVDKVVAGKIPAWSVGQEHNGTVVGALVNLGLFLALLFWPGGDCENPTFGETPGRPDKPSPRTDAGSVAAARIARATGAQFGHRKY